MQFNLFLLSALERHLYRILHGILCRIREHTGNFQMTVHRVFVELSSVYISFRLNISMENISKKRSRDHHIRRTMTVQIRILRK